MFRSLFVIVLSALAGIAAAQQYNFPPSSGFWWNPAEPGRGWAIEVQDDVVFIAHYVYDQPGNPVFLTTAGTWDGQRVVADIVLSVGGQCYGCTYREPDSSSLGTVAFEFTDFETGRIVFADGQIPIRRFRFGYGGIAREVMPGTWHSTFGALGIYFGDVLRITGAHDIPDTPGGFRGLRVGGGAQRILLGAPITPNSNQVLILIDSSTNFYTRYLLRFITDRWVGEVWTYRKDENPPTGAGLPMFGQRLAGPRVSNRILGAASATDAKVSPGDLLDSMDAARAELLIAAVGQPRDLPAKSAEPIDWHHVDEATRMLQHKLETLME
jgi:hypothetical protein